VHLVVDELVEELESLASEPVAVDDDSYPFVLSAGERRSSTANTIYRDPSWRKNDTDGALRINPLDAQRVGVADGGLVHVTTQRGRVEATVEYTETMRPGHVSLPNGLGLDYPDEAGERTLRGVAANELTSSFDRDWLAGTPWHKHVRARVEAVAAVAEPALEAGAIA
jgi:anaerobic selenocysteine-containing dehydrogenase